MGLRDSTVGKALDLHAANGAQSLAMYLVPKRSLGGPQVVTSKQQYNNNK